MGFARAQKDVEFYRKKVEHLQDKVEQLDESTVTQREFKHLQQSVQVLHIGDSECYINPFAVPCSKC